MANQDIIFLSQSLLNGFLLIFIVYIAVKMGSFSETIKTQKNEIETLRRLVINLQTGVDLRFGKILDHILSTPRDQVKEKLDEIDEAIHFTDRTDVERRNTTSNT